MYSVHSRAHVSCRGKRFGNDKMRRVAAHGAALMQASIYPPPESITEVGTRASGSVASTGSVVLDV